MRGGVITKDYSTWLGRVRIERVEEKLPLIQCRVYLYALECAHDQVERAR